MADPKIIITADTSQAERAIKDLDRALSGIQQAGKTAAVALGVVTGAAAAVTAAILTTINAAGDIVDAADALGVSASKLYELQQAAQLAGVDAQTLNATIQRLSVNIGEGLANGTGASVDAMKRLELNIREVAGLRPDEQFKKIAERLLDIKNPTDRATASVELFGKQGPKILKVAEELEKYKKISEDVGLGISERDLVALDEAADSVDQLRILWDAGVKKAIAEVAPYVVALVTRIKEAIAAAGGFDGIWKAIKNTLHTVANVIAIMTAMIVGRMVFGAAAFAVQMIRAGNAAKVVQLALARTPIGLLAAGLAFAADKLGVDLVGGAADFLDLNLDIKGAEDQINQALDVRNAKLAVVAETAAEYNKEQQKALDALDEQISKSSIQVALQQDILTLGQEEADVRSKIAEEVRKLGKVSLDLNNAEVASKLKIYETNLRNEQSIKNQIAAQNDLNKAILSMMVGTTESSKAQQKLEDLRKLQSGQTLKQIEEENLKRIQGDKTFQFLAIETQKTVIDNAIKSEISKFDKKLALEQEFEQARYNLLQTSMVIDKQTGAMALENQRLLIDAKKQLEIEYQNSKIELERQTQEKILQLQISAIERGLMAQRNSVAQSLSDADQAVLQRAGQEERQKAIVADRIAFEKKSEMEKYAFGIDSAAQMFTALGAQNKKAFEAAKAFNIANAIMNTYMAATKALATYPPPFSFIAAAAAVGMGLAQVAQIRSQQYSGREKGGPVAGGMPYMVGEAGPEIFRPSTSGSIIPNDQLGGGGGVNINFTINAVDAAGIDELLVQRRGVITSIIRDAMVENGQRGI